MRVAILADFPLHVIPEFGERFLPKSHFATWLPQLAEAFGAYPDLEVHWIVLSDLLSAPCQVRWNNQTFHVLTTVPKGRAATFYARDRRAIRACLEKIQPEIVHGWGTEDVYALAAAISGFPNVVSMQGVLSHYVLKNRMPLRACFQALLELFVLHKAERITTESAWGREVVLRRNPRARVELVEYGVQNPFLEMQWNPDPRKPVALFIGTVVPRKGIQDAVAAFRDPALAGAELWVVGDGASRWAEELRASAPPNVQWLGRLSALDTAQLLCRAWCLVLPTRADTSPNVVKEARVIGLPVVSTRCGGQVAYIEHGKNGFLVEPGDINALTKALTALLSDFEKMTVMGRRHQQEHRQLLHPHRTAEAFFDLYQKRLSQSEKPQ
ncbi:MAG: glycosyltransferase family 4 protein [Verrucomicrobia bacterium]|nr:glycosyltransferase family 4 protein [Verrucomicrobiota bacterium]